MVTRPISRWLCGGVLLANVWLASFAGVTVSSDRQQPVMPTPVMSVGIKGGSSRGLRFSADGSRIWTDRLESWSVASGKQLDSAPVTKQKGSYAFDISPVGKRMLIVHQGSGGTLIWDQDQPPRERALPKKGPARFVRLIGKGERFAALFLDVCKGRSKRIGACPDTGYWIRAGVDPLEGIRKLGDRVITIQPHDLSELSSEGHDVPWGTGKAEFGKLLQEIRRLGIRPTLIGLEYSYDFMDNMPEMAESVEFINRLKLDTPL